jgi:hypothetical protein
LVEALQVFGIIIAFKNSICDLLRKFSNPTKKEVLLFYKQKPRTDLINLLQEENYSFVLETKISLLLPLHNLTIINTKELILLLREQYPEDLGLRTRDANKTTKHFEVSFRTAAEKEAAL